MVKIATCTVAEEVFVFQISISYFNLLASTGAYHARPLSRPLFGPRARHFPTPLVIVGKQ